MADLDELTQLPTRSVFESAFQKALELAKGRSAPVSVGVVDIDLFGGINQRFGRETGDGVIEGLGTALHAAFGASGLVSRFGGDALAIMWPGLEKEQAFLVLEQFRQGLGGKLPASGQASGVEVTVSAGLSAYPDDGNAADELLNKASEALYRAKVTGRNKICLAREEKMLTKTSHYTQGQLLGLRRLAEREGIGEAVLLREGLNDILRKYNA